VVLGLKTRRGQKLGCGEWGCTYELKGRSTVVKITRVPSKTARSKWSNESDIAKQLGNIGVGPNVRNAFICRGEGYIEMARLNGIEILPGGVVLRTRTITDEGEGDTTDFIHRMPENMQQQYIELFRQMIAVGVIHMDNHLANLGLIGKRPVVFDFDFAQRRVFTEADAQVALAFSIYQVLEHTAVRNLRQTVFWKEAQKSTPRVTGLEASVNRLQSSAVSLYRATYGDNWDLYIGCALYSSLLQKARERRYSDPGYNIIYDIRMGLRPYRPTSA